MSSNTGQEYLKKGSKATLANLTGGPGAVTQATDLTTAVTLNQPSGIITTAADQIAADTSLSFTLNNSYITAASIVQVGIQDHSSQLIDGTEGIIVVSVDAVAAGSCVIVVSNADDTDASNAAAVFKIWFTVMG